MYLINVQEAVIRYSSLSSVVHSFPENLPLYLINTSFPKNFQSPVTYRRLISVPYKHIVYISVHCRQTLFVHYCIPRYVYYCGNVSRKTSTVDVCRGCRYKVQPLFERCTLFTQKFNHSRSYSKIFILDLFYYFHLI